MIDEIVRALIVLCMGVMLAGPASATDGPVATASPVAYARMLEHARTLSALAAKERKTTQVFGADEVLAAVNELHATVQRIKSVENAKWDEFMGEAIAAALSMADLRERAATLTAALEDRPDFRETRALWAQSEKVVENLNVAVAVATTQPGQRVFVPGRSRDGRSSRVSRMRR